MGGMNSPPVTPPVSRCPRSGSSTSRRSGRSRSSSLVAESSGWHVALVVLTLPLSLLALWVGYYAGLAVGFVTVHTAVSCPGRWSPCGWRSGR